MRRLVLVARTKEFDREQALERAMLLFWRKGYEATSLGDLLEAMGIARQSLYDTFGDKHALFTEALARYERGRVAALRARLASPPSVRRAFREIFEAIVDESEADKCRGCMGITTAVELAPHDAAVAKQVSARQREVEEIFFQALERARLYVVCGAGAVDVFERSAAGYSRASRVATRAGARTGLFSPKLDRLYVAARARGRDPAAVLVYRPN